MSHLQGRWVVAKEENLDEVFAASNVDSALREKSKEGLIKPEQEIVVNGDDYALTTHVGHISTTIRFKLNVAFPASSLDGKKNMTTFSLEGDKLIERQKYDDFEAVVTRELQGTQLRATIESKGVVAKVTYNKV